MSTSSVRQRDFKSSSTAKKFGILDVLRVLSGLLLLNAFLSYFFTNSSTWGYQGKFIDPRYYVYVITYPVTSHVFTDEQLSLYNGTDPQLPVYLGINGTVFDVTFKRELYEPGASYHLLAGKDACRVFVTSCLQKRDEYTYDLRGLDEDMAKLKISQWFKYFDSNPYYWKVGTVVHQPLYGDYPSECTNGIEFPYHKKNTV